MLAELDEFKAYLDMSDILGQDLVLDIILNSADSYLRTYCGREFESLRRSRSLDAENAAMFWIPEFPLTAVHGITAFTFSTDTVGLSCDMSFVSWYEAGRVESGEQIFCAGFPKSIFVDYTAGYGPDASDLKTLRWICLEIGAQMFRNRGIANMQSYNAGGVQWQKYVSDIMPMLGPEVLVILNSYRRVGPRDWI
jgi:hypothetical protein